MADDFAPLNLRARLDSLQDRIAQAKASLEANGIIGDHVDKLKSLADEHEAIRGSLDAQGTVTELQHSKATAQTDSLEATLHQWLESIDRKVKDPALDPRNASVD
jgi:hypothetical protein